MHVDAELSFNTVAANVLTAQAETTQAAHVSTNVIDTTAVPLNLNRPLYFVFQCEVVPISAGGGTLLIELGNSAAAAMSTDTVIWSSGIIINSVITAWVAQTTIYVVPVQGPFALRYVGVTYTIGTAVLTAGSWRAFLTPDAPAIIPDEFAG